LPKIKERKKRKTGREERKADKRECGKKLYCHILCGVLYGSCRPAA
jgi:hypothetical protein